MSSADFEQFLRERHPVDYERAREIHATAVRQETALGEAALREVSPAWQQAQEYNKGTEGTPVTERFNVSDAQLCLDFLAYMKKGGFLESINLSSLRYAPGLSLPRAYSIGTIVPAPVPRPKGLAATTGEVFLCEDGTVRALADGTPVSNVPKYADNDGQLDWEPIRFWTWTKQPRREWVPPQEIRHGGDIQADYRSSMGWTETIPGHFEVRTYPVRTQTTLPERLAHLATFHDKTIFSSPLFPGGHFSPHR